MNFASIHVGAPQWWVPTAVILAVLAALAVLSYAGSRSAWSTRTLGLLLKLTAITLIAICLLDPLVRGTRPRPGSNVICLLVDDSHSMQVERADIPACDEVRRWFDVGPVPWMTRLEQDFDVRRYRFAQELEPIGAASELTFSQDASNLGGALSTVARRFARRPVAGVLLVTDGIATDLQSLSELDLPFPVFSLLDADPATTNDLSLTDAVVSQSHFESSPTSIKLNVTATGLAGEACFARLTNAAGDVIDTVSFDAPTDDQPAQVNFRFRPEEAGLSFYDVEVGTGSADESSSTGTASKEATLLNNRRTVRVDRGGGPFRVLYVAGRPNWDFKFLRRALEYDDEIDLVGLLRIAREEPKFVFQDRSNPDPSNRLFRGFDNPDAEDVEERDQPVLVGMNVRDDAELRDGFPKTAEELFAYDAILIDDLEASFFTPDQQLLIRRFVSHRGGGLLMLGGLATFNQGGYARTPLEDVLPVYLSDDGTAAQSGPFRWSLSRDGWLEQWTRLHDTEADERFRLTQRAPLQILSAVGRPKPAALVLAFAQRDDDTQYPLLAAHRFGEGRSVALMAGDLWRWSLRREQTDQDELPVFWRQTMRWLLAEVPQRATVSIVPSQEAPHQIRLVVQISDAEFLPDNNASVELTITPPDGNAIKLTAAPSEEQAGQYVAEMWNRERGAYRVDAAITAGDQTSLRARPNGWVADPTSREFQTLNTNRTQLESICERSGGELVDPDKLDSFVSSLPQRDIPVTEAWVYPLWHSPWFFLLAIVCLCAEWGLRRIRGLA